MLVKDIHWRVRDVDLQIPQTQTIFLFLFLGLVIDLNFEFRTKIVLIPNKFDIYYNNSGPGKGCYDLYKKLATK